MSVCVCVRVEWRCVAGEGVCGESWSVWVCGKWPGGPALAGKREGVWGSGVVWRGNGGVDGGAAGREGRVGDGVCGRKE